MEVSSKLIENKLFKGMSCEEIKVSLEGIKYKVIKYDKDETVAFRGDEIDGLYINLGGHLVTEMMKASGEVKKIEDIESKQIIASAFIFGEKNRFPVDLVCKDKTELFFLPQKELLSLIMKEEVVLKNFLDEISNKAQFLSMKIWSSFNNKTIQEKLISYIMKNKDKDLIEFKPSLKEVANLFNVARPSLSRVIGEFVDEGLLEKSGRNRYKIVSVEGLKEKVE